MDLHFSHLYPDFYPLLFTLLHFSDLVVLCQCNRFFNVLIKRHENFQECNKFLSNVLNAPWVSISDQYRLCKLMFCDQHISLKHFRKFITLNTPRESRRRGDAAIEYLLDMLITTKTESFNRKKAMMYICASSATHHFKLMARGYSNKNLSHYLTSAKRDDITFYLTLGLGGHLMEGKWSGLLIGICANEDPISRHAKAQAFNEIFGQSAVFMDELDISSICRVYQTRDKDLIRILQPTLRTQPDFNMKHIIALASSLSLQEFLSLEIEKEDWEDMDWSWFVRFARPEIAVYYIGTKNLDWHKSVIDLFTHSDVIRAFQANNNHFTGITRNGEYAIELVRNVDDAKILLDECKAELIPRVAAARIKSAEVMCFIASRDPTYHSALIAYAITTANYDIINLWKDKVNLRAVVKELCIPSYMHIPHEKHACEYVIKLTREQSKRSKTDEMSIDEGWCNTLFTLE